MIRLLLFPCLLSLLLPSFILAEDELNEAEASLNDAPQISIRVSEVVLQPGVRSKIQSSATATLMKQISDLEEKEKAQITEQFNLIAFNETQTETQVGASKPTVTARSNPRGSIKTFEYQDIGVVFSCTPRSSKSFVYLDYLYDKSEVVPSDEGAGAPPAIVKTRVSGVVRIKAGHAIVVSGRRIGPDNKPVDWKLVLEAVAMD